MPRLEALVTRIRSVAGAATGRKRKFRQLVEEFNGLGPDVQELTMAANRHVSTLLENGRSTMLTAKRSHHGVDHWPIGRHPAAGCGSISMAPIPAGKRTCRSSATTDRKVCGSQYSSKKGANGAKPVLANMGHELHAVTAFWACSHFAGKNSPGLQPKGIRLHGPPFGRSTCCRFSTIFLDVSGDGAGK